MPNQPTYRTIADAAEAPDPGSYITAPTPYLLRRSTWSATGDSLKHYGDEWKSDADARRIVLTVDALDRMFLGVYPDIHAEDEDESNACIFFDLTSFEDAAAILEFLGVDLRCSPARVACMLFERWAPATVVAIPLDAHAARCRNCGEYCEEGPTTCAVCDRAVIGKRTD